VVALPRRGNNPERQRGGLQGGTQPRPSKPGVALPLAPRREVVRGHRCIEAGVLGALHRGQQFAGMNLLVRGVEAESGHGRSVPVHPISNLCAAAAPGLDQPSTSDTSEHRLDGTLRERLGMRQEAHLIRERVDRGRTDHRRYYALLGREC
jgi:hypothetical protein